MNENVRHVYCVPGMAADVSIFEYLKLPEDRFIVHKIPWRIPDKEETLTAYAHRMCAEIVHEDIILIGVSFGGILVQEMSRYVNANKIIIISSVKSKYELPKRMQVIRKTGMYRVFPTFIIDKIKNWEALAFGDFAKKRARMYQKYLSITDKTYLDWAIKNIVCWDQESPPDRIIHIHGTADVVFPIQNIKDCIPIRYGTHVMIVNRARWFNKNLPEIIEG